MNSNSVDMHSQYLYLELGDDYIWQNSSKCIAFKMAILKNLVTQKTEKNNAKLNFKIISIDKLNFGVLDHVNCQIPKLKVFQKFNL